jgi:hypothetical protein
MRKVTAQIIAGRLGIENASGRFNEILRGHLDIEWMGHFDQLRSGTDAFGRKLRAEFFQIKNTPVVPSIPAYTP